MLVGLSVMVDQMVELRINSLASEENRLFDFPICNMQLHSG
jgi:hypothetical protein